jgi:accessory colonization factor AcfC
VVVPEGILENSKIDAWITWLDWDKNKPDPGEIVEIESESVVYQDLNVVQNRSQSKDSQILFDYIMSDKVVVSLMG